MTDPRGGPAWFYAIPEKEREEYSYKRSILVWDIRTAKKGGNTIAYAHLTKELDALEADIVRRYPLGTT